MDKQRNGAAAFRVALDAAPSARRTDGNGFLHVKASHITKAQVVPYRGFEIPGWEERGLSRDAVYYAYRDPEELRKSVPTWNGLPLHVEHHVDSADDPQKLTRVGATGTEAAWNAPYIDNALVVWDAAAIEGIGDGSFKELSCAYRYEPDFTPGEADGVPYDFVMRDIKGNHVALVEQGRAGHDVVVADSAAALSNGGKKMAKKQISVLRLAGFALDDGEAVAKETDIGGLVKCLTAIESGVAGVPAEEGGNDGGDETLTPEELVAKYLPNADGDKKARYVALLETVKTGADKLKAADEGEPGEGAKDPAKDDGEPEEDLSAAMNRCGVDADDPAEARAFKLGLDYGRNGGAKDDGEPEPDPDAIPPVPPELADKPAADDDGADTNAKIHAIMSMVPGMDDAAKRALMDALTDLAYGGAAKDGDEPVEPAAKDPEPAMDSRMRGRARGTRLAMDAAISAHKARWKAEMMGEFRRRSAAARAVRPVLGEIDAMAYDSAEAIYGAALKELGVEPKKYSPSAWSAMFAAYRAAETRRVRTLAQDARPVEYTGAFANMSRIKVSE